MPTKNHLALIAYLDKHDIEARLVKQATVDESGYDLMFEEPRTGRPIYSDGFVRKVERRQWPNKRVWENVKILLDGGTEADLKPDVKEAARPAAPVKEKTGAKEAS